MNFGKKRSKFHMQFCLGMLSHISSSKVCFVFEILHNFMEKNTRFFQWSAFFFSKMKSNPAKKTSEQRFSGKMKPTCQNIATCIFEHFQKWPKNLEGVLACSLSIERPRVRTSPRFFAKIEHGQNSSKLGMPICLYV